MSNPNGKSALKPQSASSKVGNAAGPAATTTSANLPANRPPSSNANLSVSASVVPASGSGSRPPAKSLSTTHPVQVSTATSNSATHERKKTQTQSNNLAVNTPSSNSRQDSSGFEEDDIKTLPSSTARAALAAQSSSVSPSASWPTEFECWENQRYYPFVGWSKNVLPTDFPAWSSADGSREVTFDSVKLGPGMLWADAEWKIDRKNGDEEGWQYSVDFSKNWVGTKEKKTLHLVRRRKWCRAVVPPTPANILSSSSTVGRSSANTLGLSVPMNKASTSTMPPMKMNNEPPKAPTSLKSLYSKPGDVTINLNASNPSPLPSTTTSNSASSFSATSNSSSNSSPTGLSSSSSSNAVGAGALSKVTAVKPQTAVLRVWEHQRYYPVVGWSDKLLPTDKKHAWADDKGNKLNNGKDDVHVDNLEWKWLDDWRVVVEAANTDKDGWQYAIDFPSAYKAKAGTTGIDCFVRRRQWQRTKVMIPGASAANKKKDTAAFFLRLDAFKADLQAEADNEELVALSSATW